MCTENCSGFFAHRLYFLQSCIPLYHKNARKCNYSPGFPVKSGLNMQKIQPYSQPETQKPAGGTQQELFFPHFLWQNGAADQIQTGSPGNGRQQCRQHIHRNQTAAAAPEQCPQPEKGRTRQSAFFSHRTPVSYTHLTLPTILLV